MRKLVPALAAAAALAMSMAPAVHADLTSTVAATLSCNDGHSVALTVDQVTLTNLVAEVDAINSSGTGQSCALETAAIDPTGATGDWTVFDYNPSGQAIAPRHSPASGPASTPDGGITWQFNFRAGIFTALLTTTDPSVTGNLCPAYPIGCRTLNDTIRLSGDAGTFMTQHNGGDCVSNFPAAVRFYFVSPSASGSSVGSPPAGFYTRFWWSNPMDMQLVKGDDSKTITAHLDPNEWSDWNGQRGTVVPEAFAEATQKVQSI